MSKLVTIGIPVYKRLNYLPNVLGIVASQDYPNIELLVSDNGMNGAAVRAAVDKYYPRPYRFRQNAAIVSGSKHYNQIIDNAAGEYCVVLADDDEISPNFVSELVGLLEKHPEASVALAREETIDENGQVLCGSAPAIPEILSGADFIRATWGAREYGFQALCTFLAKTEKLKECGGFPDIWAATSDEDLLMVKLVMDNFITFSTRCTFKKRYYETSGGFAITLQDLARGIKEFVACLDSDPMISKYAASHAGEWRQSRDYLVDSGWKTYYLRWASLYRQRLPVMQWMAGGFLMPPKYYRSVASTLTAAGLSAALAQVERLLPHAYSAYRAAKSRRSRTHNTSPGSP